MIAPVSEREPLSGNRVHHGRDVGASHLLEVSDVPVLDHTIKPWDQTPRLDPYYSLTVCIRFQYCIDFGRNIFDHSFAPRSPRCKFREPRAQYQQDLERNNSTLENESVKLYKASLDILV